VVGAQVLPPADEPTLIYTPPPGGGFKRSSASPTTVPAKPAVAPPAAPKPAVVSDPGPIPAKTVPPPPPALAFSWSRVLKEAVAIHPSVAAALSSVAEQRAKVEQVRAGWKPQIRGGLTAGRSFTNSNAQQASVSASQLLYDFGKLDASILQAAAVLGQQESKLMQSVDDVALDTAVAVLDVVRHARLVREAQSLVAGLEEVLRLASARAKAGAATQVDPTTARARLDGAQVILLTSQSRLDQAQARLRQLLGANSPLQAAQWDGLHDPSTALQMRPSGEAWGQLPADAAFFDGAPALALARSELQAAEAALVVSRAARLPAVSLEAGVGQPLDRATRALSGTDTSLTINLNAPIYQGGAGDAQVQSATFAVQAATERLNNARQQVTQKWRDAELQLQGLVARQPSLAARRDRIQESRALFREQYLQLGTRSILDFLNAEQELHSASVELVNQSMDAMQARFQVLHAAGALRSQFDLPLPTLP